MSSDIVRGIWR